MTEEIRITNITIAAISNNVIHHPMLFYIFLTQPEKESKKYKEKHFGYRRKGYAEREICEM